jgi:hypothetical protein
MYKALPLLGIDTVGAKIFWDFTSVLIVPVCKLETLPTEAVCPLAHDQLGLVPLSKQVSDQ